MLANEPPREYARHAWGDPGVARRIGFEQRPDEPAVVDRRWLALAVAVFAGALASFAVALWIYHATGPHPQAWALIRGLRRIARFVLPRWSHHWHPY